jgi:hypothetical protein
MAALLTAMRTVLARMRTWLGRRVLFGTRCGDALARHGHFTAHITSHAPQ